MARNRRIPMLGVWRCVVAGVAVGVAVAGCGRLDPPPPSHVFTDPDVRFPIQVANEQAYFELPIARSKDGIMGTQRRELSAFLTEYKRSGHREIYVTKPGSHAGSPVVSATMDELWDIFQEHGVSSNWVHVRSTGRSYRGRPWITLNYEREVALAQECGVWEHNTADDRGNIPYDNLGCSQQANLAAMIAYPSDLENVRGMSPRPAHRRGSVWGKYVKGELGAEPGKGKKSKSGGTK